MQNTPPDGNYREAWYMCENCDKLFCGYIDLEGPYPLTTEHACHATEPNVTGIGHLRRLVRVVQDDK